jgi:hypothetical protein
MFSLRALQPALAALLAACVLLLGLAAWSPALHDELCSHTHAEADGDHDHDKAHATPGADHACAVTLFAAGCDTPPPPLSLIALPAEAARGAAFTEFMLARTLRGPERVCGPPARA